MQVTRDKYLDGKGQFVHARQPKDYSSPPLSFHLSMEVVRSRIDNQINQDALTSLTPRRYRHPLPMCIL